MGPSVHEGGLWGDGDGEGKDESRQVEEAAEVEARIALTEFVQRGIEVLGRQVSGDLLAGLPRHHT